ncbi:MAG: hypothetical protein ABI112_08105 [Terracoccus sp.]
MRGLVAGIFFGLIMGPVLSRQRQAARQATGVPDDADYDRALSAAGRGTAPNDPEVRAAAARLVHHQLDVATRQRRWAAPMMSVFTMGAIWFVVTDSAWWWLAVAPFVAFLVLSLNEPGRLSRRVRALEP